MIATVALAVDFVHELIAVHVHGYFHRKLGLHHHAARISDLDRRIAAVEARRRGA